MKNRLEQIKKLIKEIAQEEGIHPSLVKKVRLKEKGVTDYELLQLGGFGAIIKANFPVTDKDLRTISENKSKSSYISTLEKKLTEKSIFKDDICEIIKTKLKPLPVPKGFPKVKPKHKAKQRELVAMLNDTHYGLNVDPEEIDGLNQYGWTEASRRTAFFIKEVCEYKLSSRKETTRLNLVLNGDLQAGLIHGIASKTLDLWIHQMNGTLHILTHAIQELSKHFEEVVVHATVGNHSELPHKREGGHRVTQEHYDSFETAVYYSLTTAFRNFKNVRFNIPKTPYLFFDLPAGRVMVTHGHNFFSKSLGNPGKTINVKLLSDEIRTFNAGEALKDRKPIKLVLFGHTHGFAHFITTDGVEVYNAPSLSGLDGFAHQLNINTNFIAQTCFESTKEFILGDSRLIRLKQADKDESLDAIIPIYNKGLKWSNE